MHHADGSGRALGLQLSESPAEAHPRIHLDLFVDRASERAREVERLVAAGASRVEWDMYPPDPDFVVLAHPDGNAFCVVISATRDRRSGLRRGPAVPARHVRCAAGGAVRHPRRIFSIGFPFASSSTSLSR
ncbi:MAG TPA: VOC family protein [Actinocatenispora sp.]